MSKRLRRGQWVYFWHSCSYYYSVRFVRWCVMRNQCGREDTNKLGVGAIVESDWLFCKVLEKNIDPQCRRGQSQLRPYVDLYLTDEDARRKINPVIRPQLKRVRKKSKVKP